MFGGHHTSLFTILPAVAKLLRLIAIQVHTEGIQEKKFSLGLRGEGRGSFLIYIVIYLSF